MKGQGFRSAAAVIALLFGLAGCGGGGGGGGGSTTPTPTGTTGFSKGVITAKGSIVVNGVKFNTDAIPAGNIEVDDDTGGNVTDLQVGMVVAVKGKIDDATKTGVAEKIEFADNLEGKIDVKGTGTVTVFGQTVKISIDTIIEDEATGRITETDLLVGDRIEVSGFPDGTGALLATRIERKIGGAGSMEFKGQVSGFAGPGDDTFTVTPPGGTPLTVTLGAGVALPQGFADGMLVEVKTSSSGSSVSASRVEIEIELEMEKAENERAEIQGFVSSVSGADNTFIVNGMTVSAGTQQLPQSGIEVEVHAVYKSGALVAELIEVEQESENELTGVVASSSDIDLVAGTIKLNGTLVYTDAKTMFMDSNDSGGNIPLAIFGLKDIKAGDRIEVAIFQDASLGAVAARVERKSPEL